MEAIYECLLPCEDVDRPCRLTVFLESDDEGDTLPTICPYDPDHQPKWSKV